MSFKYTTDDDGVITFTVKAASDDLTYVGNLRIWAQEVAKAMVHVIAEEIKKRRAK